MAAIGVDALLRLRLRGRPALHSASVGWQVLSLKAAGLLVLLAVEGVVHRARLRAMLWPDDSEAKAKNNLRGLLRNLRDRAGCELFTGGEALQLLPGLVTDLDAGLHDGLQAGDGEAQPAAADLLRDLDATVLEPLQDWLDQCRANDRRRRVDRQLVRALERERRGEADMAAVLARAALAIGVERDDALALAIGLLARSGHRREALTQLALHRPAAQGPSGAPGTALSRLALAIEIGQLPPPPEPPSTAVVRTAQSPADRTHANRAGAIADAGNHERSSPATPAGHPFAGGLAHPPMLIGRETDLAAITTAWAQHAVVRLWGEPGVGKTALLHALADAGPGRLRVAALLGDSHEPLALLTRLLRALLPLDRRDPMDPERRELARFVPELGHVPPGRPQRPVLRRALQALCRHVHGQGLNAVLLDDLQWADTASTDLLAECMAGADGLHWLTARHPPAGTTPDASTTLPASTRTGSGAAPTHQLQPLGIEALQRWLQQRGAPAVHLSGWAVWLQRATGGSPRHVVELLRERTDIGVAEPPGDAPPAASALQKLLLQRLAALPDAQLDLLRLTALAGPLMSPELARSVLGLAPLRHAATCEALAQQGLMHDALLAHDGLRQPLLVGLPPMLARHLHEAIARHGAEAQAPAARLAPHWRLAQRWTDAATAFAQAAQSAERMNLPRDALRLWDQAAQAWASALAPDRRFEAELASTRLALAVEPVAIATDRATALVARAATAVHACEAHLHAANCALTVYDWATGLAHAMQALAHHRLTQDQPRSAQPAAADDVLATAEDPDGHPAPAAAAQHRELRALLQQMYALAGQGRAAAALALDDRTQALATAPGIGRRARMDQQGLRCNVLNLAGRPGDAAAAGAQALALADALNDGTEAMVLANNLAVLRVQLGQHAEAAAASGIGLRWVDRLEARNSVAGQAAVIAHAANLRRLGQLGEALTLFGSLTDGAPADPLPDHPLPRPGHMAVSLAPHRWGLQLELGQAEAAWVDWTAAMRWPGAAQSMAFATAGLHLRRHLLGDPLTALGEDADAVVARCTSGGAVARWSLAWALLPERDAETALACATRLRADAERVEAHSAARLMQLGQAQSLRRLGRHAEAHGICQAVIDNLTEVAPLLSSPVEWWYLAWQCAEAAADAPAAARALQAACDELARREASLPVALRRAFRQDQPMHRQLLKAGGSTTA